MKIGLLSPVVRNRNMVLKALEEGPTESCPADAESELREAIRREPRDDVRQSIENLLAGRPLRSQVASNGH
jgi:hypothetical protein